MLEIAVGMETAERDVKEIKEIKTMIEITTTVQKLTV